MAVIHISGDRNLFRDVLQPSQRLIAMARAEGARNRSEIEGWIKANRARWSKGVLK